jgi:hypothetical protein
MCGALAKAVEQKSQQPNARAIAESMIPKNRNFPINTTTISYLQYK